MTEQSLYTQVIQQSLNKAITDNIQLKKEVELWKTVVEELETQKRILQYIIHSVKPKYHNEIEREMYTEVLEGIRTNDKSKYDYFRLWKY